MFTPWLSGQFHAVGYNIHTPQEIPFPPYLSDNIGRDINARANGAMAAFGATGVVAVAGMYVASRLHRPAMSVVAALASGVAASEVLSAGQMLWADWANCGVKAHDAARLVLTNRIELRRNAKGPLEVVTAHRAMLEMFDGKGQLECCLRTLSVPEEFVASLLKDITKSCA